MRDRDKDIGVSATDPDRIELEDSGDSLQAALAEEERSAIAAAEEKLQSVMGDLDELKDRHRRKLAEFENMRKRTEREKGEYLRVALGKFIGDFLTISDDFDRALAHATPEEKATEAQLLAFCKERVAEFKRPKKIHIVAAVPKTASGKIQRRIVAAEFAQV